MLSYQVLGTRLRCGGGMSTQPELSTSRTDTIVALVPWYRDWILAATLGATLSADQLTKLVVKANLALGESWPAEGFLRISHGTNTGSAFGLFRGQPLILTIASILAIGFIVYYYRTQSTRRPIFRFTVGLLLGGALGNLTDRLRMGEVVDFIDVGRWPVFNLADSSIVVGMTLLVATVVLAGNGSDDHEPTETDAPVDANRDGSGYP